MAMEYYEAVGRRKMATARVRLFSGGDGSIVINDPIGRTIALLFQ